MDISQRDAALLISFVAELPFERRLQLAQEGESSSLLLALISDADPRVYRAVTANKNATEQILQIALTLHPTDDQLIVGIAMNERLSLSLQKMVLSLPIVDSTWLLYFARSTAFAHEMYRAILEDSRLTPYILAELAQNAPSDMLIDIIEHRVADESTWINVANREDAGHDVLMRILQQTQRRSTLDAIAGNPGAATEEMYRAMLVHPEVTGALLGKMIHALAANNLFTRAMAEATLLSEVVSAETLDSIVEWRGCTNEMYRLVMGRSDVRDRNLANIAVILAGKHHAIARSLLDGSTEVDRRVAQEITEAFDPGVGDPQTALHGIRDILLRVIAHREAGDMTVGHLRVVTDAQHSGRRYVDFPPLRDAVVTRLHQHTAVLT